MDGNFTHPYTTVSVKHLMGRLTTSCQASDTQHKASVKRLTETVVYIAVFLGWLSFPKNGKKLPEITLTLALKG